MKRGHIVLELPPGKDNPRNSEGAIVELKDGSLFFVFTSFTGNSYADEAQARLLFCRSFDEGETWTLPEELIHPRKFDALNIMSPSLLRSKNGSIALFFSVRYGWHDNRTWVCYSLDEGNSWSEPVKTFSAKGYYVTNNDRVVSLSDGRIIIPAAFHRLKGDDNLARDSFDSRGIAMFFHSDDEGSSWHESSNFLVLDSRSSRSGLQEPGVVELSPGVLWGFCRTDQGRQYETFSFDNGTSWTPPTPSSFLSPCSPMSVKRLPWNRKLMAVWNPAPLSGEWIEKAPPGWGRTPLVYALSSDNGKTWSDPVTLEHEDDHGYCYTAIYAASFGVFLAYCAGGPDDGICLSRLRVRKIPVEHVI